MPDVTIRQTGDGAVAEVILDRPHTGNALTPDVTSALAAAIADSGTVARCVALRSEGNVFCSGADLSFLEELVGMSRDQIQSSIYGSFQSLIRSISTCPVPVVARVQGAAVGAGCDLALACDLIVAAEEAYFEESWIRVGGTSALTGGLNLTRSVGRYRALWWLLSADRLSAHEAASQGIVHAAVPADRLDQELARVTTRIASADRSAVEAMKRLVRTVDQPAFDESLVLGLVLQADLLSRPQLAAKVAAIKARLTSPEGGTASPA